MSDTVFEKNGPTLTVRPSGRLDAVSSAAFGTELLPQLDDVRELILDFENVPYISSSGLRVIMGAFQRISPHDGTIRAIHASPAVKEIFDTTGFYTLITVSDD